MNKKLKIYKKKLFFEKNNIYNSFSKKIIKNIFLLNKKYFFFFKKYIKIVSLFFLNISNYYFDYFISCYRLIKNIFFIFSKVYNIIYKKIKINIKFLFNTIFKKNLIKDLLKVGKIEKKKKINIFFKLNLSEIFNKNLLRKIRNIIRWRKNNLKISFSIHKKWKKVANKKIKIRISSFFFNSYKFKLFLILIKYWNKNFKFKLKKSFMLYWIRYYVYNLKRFFFFIEYIMSKYFSYLIERSKFYFSFFNLKKMKNKEPFFLYFFYFNQKPYKLLNKYKLYKFFNNANKFLKFNFFKKNEFNLYLFNKINLKISKFIFFFNKKLEHLKFFIKIKFLIYLKNFFFLFYFWYLKYWFNYYYYFYFKKKIIIINFLNLFIDKNIIKIGLDLMESKIWNRNSFLNFNFFFYDNIITKKKR